MYQVVYPVCTYRLTSHGNNSFFFWKKILKSFRSIYICPRPLSETVCQQTGKRMLVKPRYKGCFKNSCLAVSSKTGRKGSNVIMCALGSRRPQQNLGSAPLLTFFFSFLRLLDFDLIILYRNTSEGKFNYRDKSVCVDFRKCMDCT